ncbi:MAG: glycosyltransferase, partial [Alphaproteobacteria bacterium]|nr:glycosyltransferase [Alphaproteobacteria bacterium]
DPARPANGDGIVIGCVAPLRPEKNLARLLRAFAAAAGDDPRWRLVVAGDGPELSRLEIVAQQLGVRHRVQFQGWVADTAEFLAGVDVAALSSDTEQAPFSVLEAAAAARAVVATDVGDVRELVSEANRPYVVAREDEDGFAAALRGLVADPGLARRVGEANREHVAARYPASRMVGALCAVMDEALVQTRSRRLVRQMLRVEPAET